MNNNLNNIDSIISIINDKNSYNHQFDDILDFIENLNHQDKIDAFSKISYTNPPEQIKKELNIFFNDLFFDKKDLINIQKFNNKFIVAKLKEKNFSNNICDYYNKIDDKDKKEIIEDLVYNFLLNCKSDDKNLDNLINILPEEKYVKFLLFNIKEHYLFLKSRLVALNDFELIFNSIENKNILLKLIINTTDKQSIYFNDIIDWGANFCKKQFVNYIYSSINDDKTFTSAKMFGSNFDNITKEYLYLSNNFYKLKNKIFCYELFLENEENYLKICEHPLFKYKNNSSNIFINFNFSFFSILKYFDLNEINNFFNSLDFENIKTQKFLNSFFINNIYYGDKIIDNLYFSDLFKEKLLGPQSAFDNIDYLLHKDLLIQNYILFLSKSDTALKDIIKDRYKTNILFYNIIQEVKYNDSQLHKDIFIKLLNFVDKNTFIELKKFLDDNVLNNTFFDASIEKKILEDNLNSSVIENKKIIKI